MALSHRNPALNSREFVAQAEHAKTCLNRLKSERPLERVIFFTER